MPLVRIDLAADTSAETAAVIGDVVYEALRSTANVPEHDKFQVISRHARDELVYPAAGYLGITYSEQIVFIQITWSTGRSTEVKRALYQAIADGIHAKTGRRKEDIWINLVEVNREDWSFGNGEMQYVPRE
ncbi:tautomerase family protein [Metapseudomonas resinovorans]|uniref:Tautomerase n=1 Tax=Metapseudomonas resinovorans NBRC 106553 TaxID=1245471 RepID=S6AII2_METRE|nr:tautomerase family protein [Pseudomonas resinovorans]BAN48195.1 hypothetical protein PCA10_24630 [Pseudomonas resinovorans NBRC 106553]